MMEKDSGHIVSIASSAGLVGVNGVADYCASKFAAVGELISICSTVMNAVTVLSLSFRFHGVAALGTEDHAQEH